MRIAIFTGLLICTTLSAQLVEKAPRPSQTSSTKKSEGSTSKKVTSSKVLIKDLLEKRSFPKHFQGYLVSNKGEQVDLFFDGIWKKAPEINGGDKTAEWSGQAAYLNDLDQPGGALYYLTSFNLGMKNGHWLARLFKWSKEPDRGDTARSAALVDEGTAEFKDGVFTIEFESYKVVLRASDSNWEAKTARLARFVGTELSTEARPKASFIADTRDTFSQVPSQYAPVWAAGIYLVLEDDNMGKILYQPFGDSSQAWVTRFAKSGGKKIFGGTRYYSGNSIKDQANIEFAGLYMNGMANFDGAVNSAGKAGVQFKYSQDLTLEEVRYSGKVEGFASIGKSTLNCTLYGQSFWIELPTEYKSELLNRVKDSSWIGSGGPYGLTRLFKRAFDGYVAQIPIISMTKADMAKMWNDKTMAAWQSRSLSWSQFISDNEIGIQKSYVKTKLFPLGTLILKSGQGIQGKPDEPVKGGSIQSGSAPEGKAEAALVLNDNAPIYKNSNGNDIRFRIKKGDAVARFYSSFSVGKDERSDRVVVGIKSELSSNFAEENGRFRVIYLESDTEKSISGHLGWMNPADLDLFYYDCSCIKAKTCDAIVGKGLWVAWAPCFLEARDKKRKELNINP